MEIETTSSSSSSSSSSSKSSSSSLQSDDTLIEQGAEGRIYTTTFLNKPAVVKERFRKTYRHPILDEKLTVKRLTQEARAMVRCRKIGIDTPTVYQIDKVNSKMIMERVMGITVNSFLINALDSSTNEYPEAAFTLASLIGTQIAILHNEGIIHGDLTTSNMMLRQPQNDQGADQSSDVDVSSLVFIDFGLSTVSAESEDKGVDLYVLERAIASTHTFSSPIVKTIIEAYFQASNDAVEIERKLKEVRSRGRKRLMVG